MEASIRRNYERKIAEPQLKIFFHSLDSNLSPRNLSFFLHDDSSLYSRQNNVVKSQFPFRCLLLNLPKEYGTLVILPTKSVVWWWKKILCERTVDLFNFDKSVISESSLIFDQFFFLFLPRISVIYKSGQKRLYTNSPSSIFTSSDLSLLQLSSLLTSCFTFSYRSVYF